MLEKKYENGKVTVVWKPDLCFHSKNCVKGLPKVFDPNRKPWIIADNASEQELMETIDKCPSGALTYILAGEEKTVGEETNVSLETMKDGPIVVKGKVSLKVGGNEQAINSTVIALCRCGESSKKPFCDGSHKTIGFTAD